MSSAKSKAGSSRRQEKKENAAAQKKNAGRQKALAAVCIAAAAALMLAACFFVYRFMFGGESLQESDVQPDLTTAEAGPPDAVPKEAEILTDLQASGETEQEAPETQESVGAEDSGAAESAQADSEPDAPELPDGPVENFETLVYVNGEETPCIYTGTLSAGKIVGKGHLEFTAEDGSSWCFDGTCVRNNIWNGTVTGQPVLFGSNEFSYTGRYSGDLTNGIPEGQGTLRISGTQEVDCTYTGGWKNGSYDGYGELIYDNENIIRYIGNFENGCFRPTLPQLLAALISGNGNRTELEPRVVSFIEEHEDDFRARNVKAFDYVGYSSKICENNTAKGTDSCFKTNIVLIQKVDYGTDTFGTPVIEILATSNGGQEVLHGFWLGDAEGLEENRIYTLRAYPLCRGLVGGSGGSWETTVFLAIDISR